MPASPCVKCRYDLSGTPSNADGSRICPECGRFYPSPRIAPGPCRRCGYDLSGTPVRSDGVAWVCPECQYVSRVEDWQRRTAIRRSVHSLAPKLAGLTCFNALFFPFLVGLLGWLGLLTAVCVCVGQALLLERTEVAHTSGFYRPKRVTTLAVLLVGTTLLADLLLILALVALSGRY